MRSKQSFNLGTHLVTLETGEIARQAGGAVLVTMEDTVVLVTVVANDKPSRLDFFPLTVDYREKFYAGGRIPGGYFKREGAPSEKEILTCRLIDRPIRPLFPDGFRNEVQVIASVLSLNPDIDPDIPAMLGASAALCLSGVPFDGPIGAARVGLIDGQFVLCPTKGERESSDLDLVVAGTRTAVLMVESEARELSEETMLGAVVFGHEQMQAAITAIEALVAEAGKPRWHWQPTAADPALVQRVEAWARPRVEQAYDIPDKQQRYALLNDTRKACVAELEQVDGAVTDERSIVGIVDALEASIVRGRILAGASRIDGRDTLTVRPISIRHAVLPRTHGSALFTRGETQALVVATLGTTRSEQIVDAIGGEYRERFMLHYNMPPFATGETGRAGGTKRREVGHGRLAKRAIAAVLPLHDDFSYTIRVVSEITEANGSSSMATVCGASLALMDAGVPLKDHVAGIAMGLIKEGEKFAVLTDILGDEDHLGDMDFKVAGTVAGITALQMDIKIQGITREIMEVALAQARAGRFHILALMRESMGSHRPELSTYAPRTLTFQIKPEKIREVIGKGGATIRALTEETGCIIEVEDDGTVRVSSVDVTAAERARTRIKELTADVEVGRVYEGTVVRLLDFGAIVQLLPGKDGLLHISQIANERVNAIADVLAEGQRVRVKVIEADEKGRVRLSMKAVGADDTPVAA